MGGKTYFYKFFCFIVLKAFKSFKSPASKIFCG